MHNTLNQLTGRFQRRKPVLTIVLDGWGIGHHDEGDAIFHAPTPAFDELLGRYAHTSALTHGPYVGLPSLSDIGGSEVGHSTLGAGRILNQGATRINQMIQDQSLLDSPAWVELVRNCTQGGGALHLIGLLSDGK